MPGQEEELETKWVESNISSCNERDDSKGRKECGPGGPQVTPQPAPAVDRHGSECT